MKKMAYLISVVIIVVIILIFTGNKSVHNETVINISVEKVWSVLMDSDNYSEWNPVMDLLEGTLKEGEKVKYRFTQDENNVSQISATVARMIPNKLLNQKGGIPIILTFNHQYILESIGDSTKVIIHEDYKGIWVNFWDPKPVEEAYDRINRALKKQAEQAWRDQ